MKLHRSNCPINFGLELFGDQWSLLIIRDLVFNGKCTYGEFLSSAEGIATNVLAKRLAKLESAGMIRKALSSTNRRVFLYSLSESGMSLVPVLVELILWGAHNGPKNEELLEWAAQIEKNKPAMIRKTLRALGDQ